MRKDADREAVRTEMVVEYNIIEIGFPLFWNFDPWCLVGLKPYSEIYQKFRIFVKLLDHRVQDQK